LEILLVAEEVGFPIHITRPAPKFLLRTFIVQEVAEELRFLGFRNSEAIVRSARIRLEQPAWPLMRTGYLVAAALA